MIDHPAGSGARDDQPHNISGNDRPERERIVDAFMSLLSVKPFEQIGLSEVAETAGVPLASLRDGFASKLDIYGAHMKAIDRAVLAGRDPGLADDPPRERLFDVLMRRFEILAPHKEAIRSLNRSARLNPPLALALNGLMVQSQQWMLAAADIDGSGSKGLLRAQGLAVMFASVAQTWLRDDEPDMAKTMAALDRALASGQGWSRLLDDLCMIPRAACRMRARLRPRPRRTAPSNDAASSADDGWDDLREAHRTARPRPARPSGGEAPAV